jgi:Ca2+-binding RTX toxin-like protein
MATATELTIDTGATALDMAQTIFGAGVQVVSASYTGDPNAAGIYSGAQTTIPGVTTSDGGVILSTGTVDTFTNSDGSTNTNTVAGAGTDNAGVDGDTDLNGVSGQNTFDGAILTAEFIPDGDMLTMQFVFTSEEYPEYVNLNVNDSFGVWVNGQFVEATITASGNIAIDTVNQNLNQNLYQTNDADQFNTEMDGITYVLSFKAPVNPGEVNTIKIGIADGGDAVYDSNVLISADSIQTVALAFDDTVQLTANSSRVVDVLANDRDLYDSGLTVTRIMGQPVAAGDTVTLATGEQVTLNPDGTLTVQSDGDLGSNVLTYEITDGNGNTDVGYLTIRTVGAAGVDGIVQGTAAGDLIDTTYTGDPDGDLVDNSDATGVYGTAGNDDYILAGDGDDTIVAGAGHDFVAAEEGNDSVEAGAGNDTVSAGAGNDTVYGGSGDDVAYLGAGDDVFGTFNADSAGNDSVYGGSGNDSLIGGGQDDRLEGGSGDDTLSGGVGSDTLLGGEGSDHFHITEDHQGDTIDGGESAGDQDMIWFGTYVAPSGVDVVYTGNETGSYDYFGTDAAGTFQAIEAVTLTDQDDRLDGQATDAGLTVDAAGGNDTVTGGAGADTIAGGSGADQIAGQGGADQIDGGDGDDIIDAGVEYELYPEYAQVSGASQALTGTNGNTDFSQATTTTGATLDTASVDLDGGFTLTGYHVGNGGDANETHTHSFSQEVAGATLTLVDIDPTESLVIWLDGVPVDLADALAQGLVSWDPGTTGFEIDASGAIIATQDPVAFPVPATLTLHLPFTTLSVQNLSPSGAGNGTLYTLTVDTNAPWAYDPDADLVDAGAGHDLVTTGIANDTVLGGAGNDTVDGGTGDDSLSGGADDDSLTGGEGRDTLEGGEGNDWLAGDFDDDALAGGAGDDMLAGGDGNDTLAGDAGRDTLQGDEGADSLTDLDGATLAEGGAGDDTITTGAADDTLSGGADNDSLEAGAGNDSADGGLGDDTVQGGAGDDTLSGGADAQVASTAPPSYVQVVGTSGSVTGTGGNADFSHAVASDGVGVAEGAATVLDGSGGSQTMTGYLVGDRGTTAEGHTHSFGADVGSVQLRIDGLDTSETLAFVIDGQPIDLNTAIGMGLVVFDPGSTPFYIDGNGHLASASDTVGPFVPATLTILGPLTSVSVQYVSAGGTSGGALYELSVDSNPAFEVVADGNDSLAGGDGQDLIDGGSGDDTLQGDAGNDTLDGGAGADVLSGGADRDLFTGGAGDAVDGGEAGEDWDTLVVTGVDQILYGGGTNEAGTVLFLDGSTLSFQNIEAILADGVLHTAGDGIVQGTAGDDTLAPGYVDAQGDIIDGFDGLDDVVQAGDGNDRVDAGAGNDSVDGGAGDDVLVAGAGADTFQGGTGQDNLDASGAATGVAIDLSTGAMSGDLVGDDLIAGGIEGVIGSAFDDTLTGFDSFDPTFTNQLYGGAGNDLIDGRGGDDVLDGGTGNDSITGGTGNDQIAGGDDRDVITAQGNDSVDGGEGGDDFDTLVVDGIQSITYSSADNESGTVTLLDGSTITFTGIETIREAGVNPDGLIWGTGGDDLIGAGYVDANGDITDNNDAILSNPGSDDDEIYALDGNDTIQSLLGDDRAYGGTGNDLVQTGAGNDYAQGDEDDDTVEGGAGDDFLRGDTGNDQVFGGDGNDSVYGGAGNDSVYGGDGDDYVYGGFGDDTVYGGAGNDTITGSGEADEVHGDDGDDLMQGSNGADTMYGGAGADTMLGEEDADTFYGGGGDYVDGYETVTTGTDDDALHVTGVQTVAFDPFNAENGTVTFADGSTLQFFNIERLYVDGVLTAPLDYVVEGSAGDDVIDGSYLGDPEGDRVDAGDNAAGTDDDLIEAYGGNDTVSAGAGNDTVLGGDGDDSVDGGDGDDSLEGGAGNDAITTGEGENTAFGGDGDDTLTGGSLFDILSGGTGNDSLDGAAGDDVLSAGTGDDTLWGGAGNDVLFGEEGNDSALGGAGNDTIWGEAGNDTILGGLGDDTVYGGDDRDSILGGIGDSVDGGEGGDDWDTLDLRGQGDVRVTYEVGNSQNGTVEFLDAEGSVIGTMSFRNIEDVIVPCFTPGTLIATDRGEVRVEALREGDRVLTRDNGYQPVLWAGRQALGAADLAAAPQLQPVTIRRGSLGLNLPERDLTVSPQHRVLVQSSRAELMFGEHEVLVAAQHLVGRPGVTRAAAASVDYIHLLFDRHEILRSNGAWSESYQPGEMTLAGMDDGPREEILRLFPELRLGYLFPAARVTLKRHEAQLLFST